MSPVRLAPAHVPRARVLRLTAPAGARLPLALADPALVPAPVVRPVRRVDAA